MTDFRQDINRISNLEGILIEYFHEAIAQLTHYILRGNVPLWYLQNV